MGDGESTERLSRLERLDDPRARAVGLAVAFVVLYLGLAFAFREFAPDRGFSPLFPPAGVMFSLFVIGGWRWLPLAVGVRVVSDRWVFSSDDALLVLLLDALAISVPYMVCAEGLRRRRLARAHPPEFAWFAVVGVGMAPTLATFGLALRIATSDGVGFLDAIDDLRAFWVGDALAIASITPLTLVGLHAIRAGRPRPKVALGVAERTEYALMLLAVAGAPLLSSFFVSRGGPPAIVVLATLPLLWVALRQDLLQAAVGTVLSVVLVSVTLRRALPFDELVEVQYLLLCGTVAASFAATVRRAHEDMTASLRISQDRFLQVGLHAPIHFTEVALDGSVRTPIDIADFDVVVDPTQRIDAEVASRWTSFGPGVTATNGPVAFSWTLTDPEERFLESIAMPVDAPSGTVDHVLVVTSDRTKLRRASEAAQRALTHDVESGLVNRSRFHDIITEELAGQRRVAGVMVVSFDQVFDLVEGETEEILPPRLTAEVARVVQSAVGEHGVVARIGDRRLGVTVLTPESAAAGVVGLRGLADITLTALAAAPEPISVMPVSIGICPSSAVPAKMITRAESAARAAGELGGDRVLVYHPALHQSRQRRAASVETLRGACDRDEFEVHYQPIVTLPDRVPVGMEALVRWRHPVRGLISPGDFIGQAERSGLIVRIDDIVCDIVADQLNRWVESGLVDDRFTVSVNISPVHLADPELANRLRDLSDRIDPRRIRIEITESAAMRDPEYTVGLLRAVRDLGFTIVLDDFGTGYSSMAWLHRLPAQVLKIDQVFVADLPHDGDALRIVELMLSLAQDLGMAVTGEGIETEAQAQMLTELGCGFGQGFLFGRPAPPTQAIESFGLANPG